MKHARLLQFVAVLTAGVVALVAGTVLWWVRPITPMTLSNGLQVHEEEVVPGDLLHYTMDYCKSADLDAEVHYSFVDGVAYAIPGMTMRGLQMGCHSVVEMLEVPNLPAGMYRIEMTRLYQISPLRLARVSAKSQPFLIKKESDGRRP